MALTPEQRKVLAAIKQGAKRNSASPKEIKAAIETGLVENHLTNRSGGDADSSGWRQERASLYKDPDNLHASIDRFFRETRAVKDNYGRAGDLAAAVQRPRADLRGRYQEHSAEADSLLNMPGGTGGKSSPQKVASRAVTTSSVVPDDDARKRALASYLLQRGRPGALSELASGISAATKTVTTTTPASTATAAVPKAKSASSAKGHIVVDASANRAGAGMQKSITRFLEQLAGHTGPTVEVGTGTNHNRMTTSGNVSDHWDGNAGDLLVGGDARQSRSASAKGDKIAAHAIQQASGKSYGEALAMARKGGLWNFETSNGRVQILWKTMTGGNHFNHVHVGVNPHR